MQFCYFETACRAAGLQSRDCGMGHWQITGGAAIVNFYADTKKGPAYYVNGARGGAHGRDFGDHDDPVAVLKKAIAKAKGGKINPLPQAVSGSPPCELDARQKQSLLFNFAIQAPPVPDWFEPVMPEKPQRPNHVHYSDGAKKAVYRLRNELPLQDLSLGEVEAARKFIDLEDNAATRIHAWEAEREIQRVYQWPWHYAKNVIAAQAELI